MSSTEAYLNTTSAFADVNHSVTSRLVVTSCIVATIGLVANGFVLVVLLGYGRLRYRPSTLLVVHQTMTDAICSAFLLTSKVTSMTLQGTLGNDWGSFVCHCLIGENRLWTAFTASTFSLVSIMLERYLVVVHPVFHWNHFTKRLVAIFVVID